MQFEILNIIYFSVFVLTVFLVCRNFFNKNYIAASLIVAGVFVLTFDAYYTLTEKHDVARTVNIMAKQKISNEQNSAINNYLEGKEKEKLLAPSDSLSREQMIELQSEINKKLINELENKHQGL